MQGYLTKRKGEGEFFYYLLLLITQVNWFNFSELNQLRWP